MVAQKGFDCIICGKYIRNILEAHQQSSTNYRITRITTLTYTRSRLQRITGYREQIINYRPSKGGITLERKRKQYRLKWMHTFTSCVFTLKSGRDQREFRFCFRSNIILP